jgi:hypothetical protein
MVCASDYALVYVEYLSSFLEDIDILLGSNLPFEESDMLIKPLADYTQDPVPHS